jgi:hypothetical protein
MAGRPRGAVASEQIGAALDALKSDLLSSQEQLLERFQSSVRVLEVQLNGKIDAVARDMRARLDEFEVSNRSLVANDSIRRASGVVKTVRSSAAEDPEQIKERLVQLQCQVENLCHSVVTRQCKRDDPMDYRKAALQGALARDLFRGDAAAGDLARALRDLDVPETEAVALAQSLSLEDHDPSRGPGTAAGFQAQRRALREAAAGLAAALRDATQPGELTWIDTAAGPASLRPTITPELYQEGEFTGNVLLFTMFPGYRVGQPDGGWLQFLRPRVCFHVKSV